MSAPRLIAILCSLWIFRGVLSADEENVVISCLPDGKRVSLTLLCSAGTIKSASAEVGYSWGCKGPPSDSCATCSADIWRCLATATDVRPNIASCNDQMACDISINRQSMGFLCGDSNFVIISFKCNAVTKKPTTLSSQKISSSSHSATSTLKYTTTEPTQSRPTSDVSSTFVSIPQAGSSVTTSISSPALHGYTTIAIGQVSTHRGEESTLPEGASTLHKFPWSIVGAALAVFILLVAGVIMGVIFYRRGFWEKMKRVFAKGKGKKTTQQPAHYIDDNPTHHGSNLTSAPDIHREEIYQNDLPPTAMLGTAAIYGNETGDSWQNSNFNNKAVVTQQTVNGQAAFKDGSIIDSSDCMTISEGVLYQSVSGIPVSRIGEKIAGRYEEVALCSDQTEIKEGSSTLIASGHENDGATVDDMYTAPTKTNQPRAEPTDSNPPRPKPTVAVKPTIHNTTTTYELAKDFTMEGGKSDYYNVELFGKPNLDENDDEFEMAENVIYG